MTPMEACDLAVEIALKWPEGPPAEVWERHIGHRDHTETRSVLNRLAGRCATGRVTLHDFAVVAGELRAEREQACPSCAGTGVIPYAAESVPCDCPAGERYAVQAARPAEQAARQADRESAWDQQRRIGLANIANLRASGVLPARPVRYEDAA